MFIQSTWNPNDICSERTLLWKVYCTCFYDLLRIQIENKQVLGISYGWWYWFWGSGSYSFRVCPIPKDVLRHHMCHDLNWHCFAMVCDGQGVSLLIIPKNPGRFFGYIKGFPYYRWDDHSPYQAPTLICRHFWLEVGPRVELPDHEVYIPFTLPQTNSSPLKMVDSNRNLLFQWSIFRGYVSFREGTSIYQMVIFILVDL